MVESSAVLSVQEAKRSTKPQASSPSRKEAQSKTAEPQEDPGELQEIILKIGRNGERPTHSAVSAELLALPARDRAKAFQVIQQRFGNRYVQMLISQARRDEKNDSPGEIRHTSSDKIPASSLGKPLGDTGRGRQMEPDVQASMESSFNRDLNDVRIHTDSSAARLALAFQAQAFTVGQDVFFGSGKYQPGTFQGRALLAHEIAHTRQNAAAVVLTKGPLENVYHRERAAQNVAGRAAAGLSAGKLDHFASSGTISQISRQASGASPVQVDVEAVAGQVVENLSADPGDRRGVCRQMLAFLDPAARSAVISRVQSLVQPQVFQQFSSLIAAPKAGAVKREPERPEPKRGAMAAPAKDAVLQPEKEKPKGEGGVASSTEAKENPGSAAPSAPVQEAKADKSGEAKGEEVVSQAGETEEVQASADGAGPQISNLKFQEVVKKTKEAAALAGSHAPAQAKSAEAQAAASGPANEVSSQAAAGQVEAMSQVRPKPFDKAAFKAALMQKIASITPRNLEEADKFKESGGAQSLKGDLTDQVNQSQEQSQGDLSNRVEEEPDRSGIEPKPVSPLPPAEAARPLGIVNAAEAAVGTAPDSQVSLQQGSDSLNSRMSDAGVTDEQLESSNEPDFQSALQAKRTAQDDAISRPQEYRKSEQEIIGQAQSEMGQAEISSLTAMQLSRSQQMSGVRGQQIDAKGQDEQERARVSDHIQQIYDQAKSWVQARLKKLDDDVSNAFDKGAAGASSAFEEYVDRKMKEYKDERYSGLDGLILWAGDKLLGLPDEVNRFYEEGKALYISRMDAVIESIAVLVEAGINESREEIERSKKEIQNYVASQPASLRSVAEEAAQGIQSRFEELESSITDRQNQLIDTLANKYVESSNQIDARIQQMRAENGGMVSAALDAVNGVIETIIKLKDMLLSTLARAASAVDLIIKDPIKFLGNLVAGVKQGLQNFMGKIGHYLLQGLMGWLFGVLAEAGIQLPESFDLKGILSLVLQVLGLTYANIRSRAVSIVGERVVSALETTAGIIYDVITKGPGVLWDWIKEKLGDLKSMILEPIKSFVQEKIIVAGITWILGLLNPAGAFIKAVKAIYDIIMFFVERGSQIMALVNAVIDSVVSIATGNISVAANFVEKALASAIPVAIGFLASLLGLGGISEKIKSVIEAIRAPINRAIDWVVGKAVSLVKAAGRLLGIGRREEEESESNDPAHDAKVEEGLLAIDDEERTAAREGKITVEGARRIAASVKANHPVFKSITVVDGGDSWDYDYVASPTKKKKGPTKETDFEILKWIYDPLGMRGYLECKYGEGNVESTTVPSPTMRNVHLAGKSHPKTGVVFDSRGYPIFDSIAKFETRIMLTGNRSQDLVLATEKLDEFIKANPGNASRFSPGQLDAIRKHKGKIPYYTWHHHQDGGRMQLISSRVHSATGHLGSFKVSKGV